MAASSSLITKLKTYCIGYNGCGQMGFGSLEPLNELTLSPFPFSKVHASNRYSLYSDDNFENIWCAGYNNVGQ